MTAKTAGAAPSTWSLLYAHLRPHKWVVAAGALITFAGALLALAQPIVAKMFLDALAEGRTVTWLLVLLAGLLVGGAALGAAGMYLVERCAETIVLTARRRMVSRLLRLRLDVVDRIPPGDLLSRVTADSTQLRSAATSNLVDLVIGAFQLLGMVVIMAYLDLTLLGVVLGVLVVIGGAAATLLPRIRQASLHAQEALGVMGSILERALGAFRTVKASGAEGREAAVIDAAATDAWRRGLSAARWMSVAGISTGLVVQVSFLLVLGVGGARVAAGGLPLSSLIAFLLCLFYLTGPITQLTNGASGLQMGIGAARRVKEVDDLPVEPVSEESGTPVTAAGGLSVSFRNVSFGYGDEPLLRDLTFDVPATGLSAVVGPSGTGKTTMFSLLERFYEPQTGRVEVGGRDVRDWPLPELRSVIGYVEQDAPVLAGTLRDNLLLAAPDASEEELREVIALARLQPLIDKLPQGLDSPVGHRGMTLSGGERQRIAIARALLRRPKILLLDEATSQLDAVNELALRDVIADVARTTTVIVIAHRLSTVTGADRILLLESGRMRALGTHTELVGSDELYRTLATTQLLADEVAA
ncbi:putative ABC transporter ATP-binding protein [Microbispora rosea subsp. aerata]|nr:ABC transporter ATP-binding protein [Microbispora rosea]GGO00742.1 putative ABC transporter ATP-binding protein [Microbispora rosea subsp. aerata]GIH56866.1 putative ABC transporter ATP-binding protein [Microbispora rosea subsp. aerata]GLJ84351.1 putative ABC transporter ATP-binding protein [Microbispora rosea subsp. aerata]